MRIVVLLCNVVLFAFTCFVLATDGAPDAPAYVVFTLLLLLIPVFTVFSLASDAGSGTTVRRVAAVLNLLLLAFVAWALVDQYPHPEEQGVVPFAVLALLTPALSAFVLFRRAAHIRPRAVGTNSVAPQS